MRAQSRTTRARRGAAAAAVLVIALAFPAVASAAFLQWNDDGASQATFGPNATVTISLGAFNVTSGCVGGVNDSFFPATDIYVIAAGSAAEGANLVDASGSENAVFGASGGLFVDETIAFTTPGGNLGGGTYDVVYDECQDGKFQAATDTVFSDAITVNIPGAGVPSADPAIAAIKNAAGAEAVQWLQAQFMFNALLTALDAYEKVQCALDPIDCFFGTDALIGYAVSGVQRALGVDDPKEIALAALANQVKHYQAIKLDPPDPAFQQLTTLGEISNIQPQSADPLVTQTAALARATSQEQALAEALLHAIERYQGADLADNGDWALAHARSMKELGAALSTQLAKTSTALTSFGAALAADGRALDDYAADLETLRARIVTSGLTLAEEQRLRNAGFTVPQIEALLTEFVNEDLVGTKAELQAQIASLTATNTTTVTALGAFATEVDSLIFTLEADPGVFELHPIAHAGGPYTGTEGTVVAFDASASAARPGASLTAFEWDLDGDGAFDDGSTATPSFTYDTPVDLLVGLRVQSSDGWTDTSYVRTTIAEANAPPAITARTPALLQQSVPTSGSKDFTVTTSDPEGDPVTVAWTVDGDAAGTGPSFTYSAPADAGTHLVRAVATDGPTGGSAAVSWSLEVEAQDADADGWNANVDCVDSDAAIPGPVEIVGNGKDDDCDPTTIDGGNAPVAAFSHVVSPGLVVAFTDTSTDVNDDIAEWAWDFGDGATSTLRNPSHTYAVKGTKTVTLTVEDSNGNTDTVTEQLVVASAPLASFTYLPPAPVTGGEIDFTDTSSDADGTVESWAWEFGDGATSTEQHPTHVYVGPGTFAVTLTVTDDDGATGSATQNVVVGAADPGTAPAALFRPDVPGKDVAAAANGGTVAAYSGYCCGGHEPWQMLDDDVGYPWATNGVVGNFASIRISTGAPRLIDSVQIQPRSDCCEDQRVRGFAVDVSTTGFADADFTQVLAATTANSGTLQTFALPEGTAATYVRYRPLTNNGSCCYISTSKFKVISSSSGPRTVTFLNESTNAVSYEWEFGDADGETSTEANPTHTFVVVGTYTVTLTARAADGRTSTFTRQYEARGPTADFSVEPAVPEPGETVVLRDTSLYPSAPGQTFSWDFGGGNTVQSSGTLHTFTAPGDHPVTYTVTDAEGNSDSVTRTVTVAAAAPSAPPKAQFSPRSGWNVASSLIGAGIVESSGQYGTGYPPATILDDDPNNSYWATPSGTPTNGFVKIRLLGAGGHTIDRIRLTGRGGAERVRDFEVWASTTGTADADFSKILTGSNPNDDAPHEHLLAAPARASYLLLKVLNNHGSACCIGVGRFEASGGPILNGRNLALAADGASIGAFSGQYDATSYPVTSLIDGDPANNPWLTTNGVMTGYAKVALSNGVPRIVDQIRLQPRWGGQRVKDFELAVSTTGLADSDFVTVFAGTAADNESLQTIPIYPILPAKYVRYRVKTNRVNGNFTGTGDLRVDTGQETSSRTVQFLNLSRRATSYLWDFGDGSTSTDVDPLHTYAAAGTYTVTLTATNANGSATFELEQVVRAPEISYSPATPEAQQQIDFTDSSPAELGLRSWAWDFGDGTTSAFQNPVKTYAAAGTYTVTMTGTDREGNTHVATESVEVGTPAFRAQFHPRGTFNMASLENGAAVIDFSSQYADPNWFAPKLLDAYTNTAWHSSTSPPQSTKWMKFSLAGGQTYQLDSFQLLGRQDCCFDQHPRDFEIGVSTTGTADADFKTVLRATLPASQTTLQTFQLPRPVLAKYVLYRVLSNRGSGNVTTAMLRATSGQVNTPTVTFDDLTVGGVAPISHAWDFGDGGTSTDASPTHTFPGPGTYQVSLTVTDGTGATSTHTLAQKILSDPAAAFTNTPATPNEAQSTTFTDTTPSPPDGPIVERRWSWGDGTPNTVVQAASTAHTFADNGAYDVTLEVLDAWGQTASVTRTITVSNVAPTVAVGPDWRWREDRALTATPTTGDVAGARDPITCSWTYGDGSAAGTGCPFNHTYADTGTYTATLTVDDGDGGTTTDSFDVEVIEQEVAGGGGSGGGTGTGSGNTSKDYVYTLDADFELGTMLNVNHEAPGSDQLQLNKEAKPFPFVYIANSGRGTAVRIDVDSGQILGEFWTAPGNRSRNPSRTTVDKLGNVWVTNRDEGESRTIDGVTGAWGSTTRIGLLVGGTRSNADGTANPTGEYVKAPFEYNTCVDKDGDGLIRTSRGLGNILAWDNTSGVDHDGGVETAVDECIQFYVRVLGVNTRTVAIDAENDAWIGGANNWHEEVDGETGQRVPGTAFNLGCGGYGGLIDGNGILWSARYGSGLLRYDTVAKTGVCLGNSNGDYGLGVDPVTGNIWHTGLGGNFVAKLNPAATTQATLELSRHPHGNNEAQGVAVDGKGNVWVAHALFGAPHIGRVRTDGVFLGNADLGGGSGPTGVAVDANGKVWAANYGTSNATRVDPEIGQKIAGTVPSGWHDMVVSLGSGASPYNYSDMTGAVAVGAASPSGFWSIKQDGTALGTIWRRISWDGSEPSGTSIVVEARAADTQTDLPSTPFVTVTDGAALSGIVGRFVEVRATLQTTDQTATPILTDIRISANTPPVASNGSAETPRDTPVTFALSATDGDGDALTYEIVDGPAHGGVTLAGADATYTPAAGYSGPDAFTFRARDASSESNVATVTLNVTSSNTPPVATDLTLTTPEDTPLAIVLAGTDADGDPVAAAPTSSPAHGVFAAGVYTPALDFHGTDSFTFVVTDGQGGSDAGTVNVTVTPVNDPPDVVDRSVEVDEDGSVAIVLTGTDVDGDTLAITTAQPAHGAYAAGVYTPTAGYSGVDSFSYTADDGQGGTDTATVAITVRPQNDAPEVADVLVETDEDTPLAIALAGTDADGDALTITTTAPGHGSYAGGVYTPEANYHGPDSFTYTADDGQGGTDTATVSITVRPVNDPPLAADQSVVLDEDTSLAIVFSGSDVDGDPLTFAAVSAPLHGSWDGSVYTPAAGYHGPDSFEFLASDGRGGTDAGTISISVRPVNDPPTVADRSVVTDEDTPLVIALAGTDADGDTLTITTTAPGHGGYAGGVYTPAANYHGPDSFTYTASDGNGGSDTATVSITVRPVNDPPLVADRSVTTQQETPVALALAGTDVDGDTLSITWATPFHGSYDGATYTPAAGYSGPDQFSYTASDGQGGSATALVSITVLPSNPPADTTPPACEIVEQGKTAAGNAFIRFRVTETGSGLARHEPGYLLNTNVSVQPYAIGSLGPVTVTATAINKRKSMAVEVFFYDLAGNRALCDPIMINLQQRRAGKLQDEVFRQVPGTDHRVTIRNGKPGMRKIVLRVNGRYFGQHRLQPGQVRRFTIATAMKPGYVNTIRLQAHGPTGAKATITIANIP